MDLPAESLANLIRNGSRFRLVAVPELGLTPKGAPLIVRANDFGEGPVVIAVEGKSDSVYRLDPTSTVTVAPA